MSLLWELRLGLRLDTLQFFEINDGGDGDDGGVVSCDGVGGVVGDEGGVV